MRATRVALVLLAAVPGVADAGFKLKLTQLTDIEPVVRWDTEPPPPVPPAGPTVLVCFHPPGGSAGYDPTPSWGTTSVSAMPEVTPMAGSLGPVAGPLPAGASSGSGGPDAMSDGTVGALGPSGPATVSNPEPTGLTLAAIGIAGMAACGWRRSRRSAN